MNADPIHNAKSILKKCIDIAVRANPVGNNPAYQIYCSLFANLGTFDSLEKYLNANPNIKAYLQEIRTYVLANYQKQMTAGVTERIAKCRTIGIYIQEVLLPARFVMQKPTNPNLSADENVLVWFNDNQKLIPNTDSDVVTAGFLAIF